MLLPGETSLAFDFDVMLIIVLFDFQPVPEDIPKSLRDLVELIMVKNPDERPRFVVSLF